MTVKELGPSIGKYKSKDIPGYIVDGRGDRMSFHRIAKQEPDGCVELSQLAPDECVIAPGLIYKAAEQALERMDARRSEKPRRLGLGVGGRPRKVHRLNRELTMKTHELKIWPEFFDAVEGGGKTFELRKNDRGFKVDDCLHLREWNPKTGQYSGRETRRIVVYMLEHRDGAGCAADFGLKDGYAILAIAKPPRTL